MGRVVIVVYRPKRGKEAELLKVIEDHMPVLKGQQLVTNRKPIVMKAADGSVVEVFEWKSAKAIEEAHTNPAVGALWERFSKVCDYEVSANVAEFQNLFAEFESVN
jgi:hypothetical protein